MTIQYCEICGRPIMNAHLNNGKPRTTCSFDCRQEARRRRARKWKASGKSITEHGTVAAQYRHGTGWGALAHAIVQTAVEDIRNCRRQDIINYENPYYRAKLKHAPRKMDNYLDARDFLLSKRMTGLSNLDGKGIFKILMEEKGIEWNRKSRHGNS